jgi:hypothetical protein
VSAGRRRGWFRASDTKNGTSDKARESIASTTIRSSDEFALFMNLQCY